MSSSSVSSKKLLNSLRKRQHRLTIEIPTQPYYSGEKVKGTVYWKPPTKPLEAFAIRICLTEVEECSWKEKVQGKSDPVKFIGKHVVFESTKTLWPVGEGKHRAKKLLPPEPMQFPFSLKVPLEAIPTMAKPKNKFDATVTCTLTAFIDTGNVVDNLNKETIQLKILNYYEPTGEQPKVVKLEKKLGTLFKSKELVKVSANLERDLIPNGEDAILNISVDNQSPRKSPMLRARSFEEFCYSVVYPPDKAHSDPLVPSKSTWERKISLPLKDDLPTSNFVSKCYSLNYVLKIRLMCTGGNKLCMQTPLVLCSPHPALEKAHKKIPFSFFVPSPEIPDEFKDDDENERFNADTGIFEPVPQDSGAVGSAEDRHPPQSPESRQPLEYSEERPPPGYYEERPPPPYYERYNPPPPQQQQVMMPGAPPPEFQQGQPMPQPSAPISQYPFLYHH